MATAARRSGAGEDRLSSLPDDVLINNILSRLPMLEAQRTSILGRRWRSLWLGLDLDGSHKAFRFHPNPKIRNGVSEQDLVEAASKYAEWVDQTIAAYRGATAAALRHFRVLFRLGDSNARSIRSWLEFSFTRGVEVLELDCCYTLGFPQYRFPSIQPTRFPKIRLLKSLTVKTVLMPYNDSLGDLLSACEFLQTLHLAHVSGLTRVNVTGPVSRLKHIHIESCHVLESITIRAPTPDLVSFTYPVENQEIALHIEHAPRLVDLRLRVVYHSAGVHPLFHYLSQLEALHLVYFSGDKEVDPVYHFPVLSRLKHLKLNFNESGGCKSLRRKLHYLATLIQTAPILQHLTLEVGGLGKPLRLRRELTYLGIQLPVPVIEIAGFNCSQEVDRKLALHLIKASPSLEKLIIDRRDPSRRGCMLGPYAHSEKTLKRWEKVVKEEIEPQLPSKAKLVII